MKVLIAFTTYNHVEITRECVGFALDLPHDIIVIDDCSTDGTLEYLKSNNIGFYTKPKRKGLTDSWNVAYRIFKDSAYTHLVLANNDILIPNGAVEGMASDKPLTTPMCNLRGAGYIRKDQAIDNHFDLCGIDPEEPTNVQAVQDSVSSFTPFRELKNWTGYCMCFSRGIIDFEHSENNLLDPLTINVGNDDDLKKRVQCYLSIGSFVYHYKGVSFDGKIKRKERDNLT